MACLQKGSECDCETCTGGDSLPERFGGWFCTCICHDIKREHAQELKALENVKDYCKTKELCSGCLIIKQCDILYDATQDKTDPEKWTIFDMFDIIKKIKGERK